MHYLEIYNKNARVSEHTANIDMMILKALEEKGLMLKLSLTVT